uniref:RING-type domain-containing protein n=1 Tax=Rhizophagus irregularis (strain DAOM 181602 / DAOM 197198 / MUCL 43194) TaxID=747089 RepID=U9SLY4_RHIID
MSSSDKSSSLTNLRIFAYNVLKSLEDKAVGDNEFPELRKCTECGNEILSFPFKALTLLGCGHAFHRLCIEKKLLHAETGRGVDIIEGADTRRDSQSGGSRNTTRSTPSSSKNKKRANEITDSSSSKKYKKHAYPGATVSSDTTPLSKIKEKKGLYRESAREVEGDRTFFELYLKISNAEERNENARHELIIAYYLLGEELEKRLVRYRKRMKTTRPQRKSTMKLKISFPKRFPRMLSERSRKVEEGL